ncbi:MAG: DUF2461 domain-containing protein [Chitinophagaceae bacterium]|nr:MAG: DUF2461 domain-containing protein [Chitinophagaceae bacterium]
MIKLGTLSFLKQLQVNNNKPWFDANKETYQVAREAFIQSVEDVLAGLQKLEPQLASQQAKQCIFRINRDVRFSKNKLPYKNNMSAYFNRDGKKGNGAGYYMHIEPGNSFAAAGIWAPEPADLGKIRQEIDYNLQEWLQLTGSSSFNKQFREGLQASEKLVRPPKGYDEENPAIEFLKLKNFVVTRPFADEQILSKSFIKELMKAFETAKPLVDFVNRALD